MRSLWIASLFLALAGRVVGQETGPAVIEKAIEAHGGAALLDRHPAARARIKATLIIGNTEVPALVETVVQLPGQFKNVIQLDVDGQKQMAVQVLDGNQGWMRRNGKTIPLDGAELTLLKEAFYAEQTIRLTPLLRDKNYRLTVLAESKVDGQPTRAVKVSHPGRPDINLSFDKTSGLLVKSERRIQDAARKEVLQEEIYRDYKTIQGVKRPTKLIVLRDGKKFLEGTILDFMPLDKVDAKEFAKP